MGKYLELAKRAASEQDKAVIARIYEYDDSELVWTPDGSDVWPPKRRKGKET